MKISSIALFILFIFGFIIIYLATQLMDRDKKLKKSTYTLEFIVDSMRLNYYVDTLQNIKFGEVMLYIHKEE